MSVADTMLFALLALADVALLARFRILRKQRERMSRSLKLALSREMLTATVFPQRPHLLRAS